MASFAFINRLDLPQSNCIEEAFEAECVDEMVIGDWEDVQITLGLISERTTPKRSYWDRYTSPTSPDDSNQLREAQNRRERTRRRNKQALKAKKQNRRKR